MSCSLELPKFSFHFCDEIEIFDKRVVGSQLIITWINFQINIRTKRPWWQFVYIWLLLSLFSSSYNSKYLQIKQWVWVTIIITLHPGLRFTFTFVAGWVNNVGKEKNVAVLHLEWNAFASVGGGQLIFVDDEPLFNIWIWTVCFERRSSVLFMKISWKFAKMPFAFNFLFKFMNFMRKWIIIGLNLHRMNLLSLKQYFCAIDFEKCIMEIGRFKICHFLYWFLTRHRFSCKGFQGEKRFWRVKIPSEFESKKVITRLLIHLCHHYINRSNTWLGHSKSTFGLKLEKIISKLFH